MADDPRDDRAETIVKSFLQHKSMGQRQAYLSRGRRFAGLDVGQLNAEWVTAVRSWLARKERKNEQMMDDLTAELRLRGIEPPYDAVRQELVRRFDRLREVEQEKTSSELVREIGKFMRESKRPLH
jgi:hypothetical protein